MSRHLQKVLVLTCIEEGLATEFDIMTQLGGGLELAKELCDELVKDGVVYRLGRFVVRVRRGWTEEARCLEHVCCRCGARGSVINRHIGRDRERDVQRITWKCEGCGRFVCFNCTLTVPGSIPLEFRDKTLCSEGCWEKVGKPDD